MADALTFADWVLKRASAVSMSYLSGPRSNPFDGMRAFGAIEGGGSEYHLQSLVLMSKYNDLFRLRRALGGPSAFFQRVTGS